MGHTTRQVRWYCRHGDRRSNAQGDSRKRGARPGSTSSTAPTVNADRYRGTLGAAGAAAETAIDPAVSDRRRDGDANAPSPWRATRKAGASSRTFWEKPVLITAARGKAVELVTNALQSGNRVFHVRGHPDERVSRASPEIQQRERYTTATQAPQIGSLSGTFTASTVERTKSSGKHKLPYRMGGGAARP